MKTDLTTMGSYLQSKARKVAGASSSDKPKESGGKSPLPPGSTPDYKLDLSPKGGAPGVGVPTPGMPSLPSMPSLSAPSPEPSPKVDPEEIIKDQVKETPKVEEIKAGSQKRPAVIFIKGLDVFSSPSTSETGYAGLGKIAENVKGSRLYGWDQKDEILKEIKKVASNQPVIIVGHSFGGDTAVDVANSLDSLEYGFRKVDVLITLDAIGFNNDIIPQNVKKHLNIFGESSFFLNDGPHVARRVDKTEVVNILSPLDHTDLDDDKTHQYEIVKLIQEALEKPIA